MVRRSRDGDLWVEKDLWRSAERRAEIAAEVADRRLDGHVNNVVAKNMAHARSDHGGEKRQRVEALQHTVEVLSKSVSKIADNLEADKGKHLFQPGDNTPLNPGPSFGPVVDRVTGAIIDSFPSTRTKAVTDMHPRRSVFGATDPQDSSSAMGISAQRSFVAVSKEILRVDRIKETKPKINQAVSEVMNVLARSIALMAAESVRSEELIRTVASIRANQYSDRSDHRMHKIYLACLSSRTQTCRGC